jgi:hypothetical protein
MEATADDKPGHRPFHDPAMAAEASGRARCRGRRSAARCRARAASGPQLAPGATRRRYENDRSQDLTVPGPATAPALRPMHHGRWHHPPKRLPRLVRHQPLSKAVHVPSTIGEDHKETAPPPTDHLGRQPDLRPEPAVHRFHACGSDRGGSSGDRRSVTPGVAVKGKGLLAVQSWTAEFLRRDGLHSPGRRPAVRCACPPGPLGIRLPTRSPYRGGDPQRQRRGGSAHTEHERLQQPHLAGLPTLFRSHFHHVLTHPV